MAINERAYLEALRAHAADTRSLLSNDRKKEREYLVVRGALRMLGVVFGDAEIEANPEENSDVDVFFRTARFQVKDITGRRGDYWKAIEARLQAAQSIEQVGEPGTPSDPVPLDAAIKGITKALGQKEYSDRSDLDALVYVDLKTKFLRPTILPTALPEELSQQGWRSVSMLFPPYAIVVSAAANAPDFLRERAGRLFENWVDGLFDS